MTNWADPTEDIKAMLAAQETEEPPVEPPVEPAEEPPVEPVEPTEPPEPADPDLVTLPDGTTMSLSTIRELSGIKAAFEANPRVQEAVTRAVQENGLLASPTAPAPTAPAPTAPAAPSLPEDIDPNDPVVRYFQSQTDSLRQTVEQQNALLARQAQVSQTTGVQRAKEDLHKKYPNLTHEDVAQLDVLAASRGLGTHFMNQYGDPYRAAYEAMETAAYTVPDIRGKLIAAPQGTTPITKKQQTLNALAGKGGTAPRTEPAPQKLSKEDTAKAIADEIRAAMQAN